MRSLLATALAVSMFAGSVHAGGPVIIQEEGNPEVVQESPASSIGLLPVLIGVVVLCAVLCGGDDKPPGSSNTNQGSN
jgi:hypothetical protein